MFFEGKKDVSTQGRNTILELLLYIMHVMRLEDADVRSPYTVIGTGFIVGLLSGLLGLGGGVLLVPIMVSAWGVQQHVATATSLAVVVPAGIISSILYQHQGNLDLLLALKITTGSIVGAYIGSTLACKLPAATLKKLFGGMLLLVGIRMVIG